MAGILPTRMEHSIDHTRIGICLLVVKASKELHNPRLGPGGSPAGETLEGEEVWKAIVDCVVPFEWGGGKGLPGIKNDRHDWL
jgi:hypothetical protein